MKNSWTEKMTKRVRERVTRRSLNNSKLAHIKLRLILLTKLTP